MDLPDTFSRHPRNPTDFGLELKKKTYGLRVRIIFFTSNIPRYGNLDLPDTISRYPKNPTDFGLELKKTYGLRVRVIKHTDFGLEL